MGRYEKVEKLYRFCEACIFVPEGLIRYTDRAPARIGDSPCPYWEKPSGCNNEINAFVLLNKRELTPMNNNARKKRTLELQLVAAQILATSGADISEAVAIRPLARALAKLSGCGYRTAVRHIEWAILHARNKKT
jgi:hypothetical protein